jgi:2-methylcitrate dehydratase PrpD
LRYRATHVPEESLVIPKSHTDEPIAIRLARYFVSLRYEDLPADVIDGTKALIRDQCACQLIGSTMPWTAPALDLANLARGAGAESTIVNYGSRLPAAEAAFVNATFGQACELDDSAHGAGGHIGAATIPVALAMGEREKIDGRRFLLAIVCGYEIMYRLMAAITPHNIERGFHGQSIAGPFAGAVAAGIILGLDQERMAHAIAIAGSHSCGPLEYDQSGGEVKRIHAGLGARGGIHSALLAQFGLTGPMTIIEGKRGFCNIFADRSEPSRILSGLGEEFSIHNVSFKLYPALGALHTAIAAAERLAAEHDIAASQVRRIRVGLAKGAMLHGVGISRPHDVIGAQFSLAFSIALVICKRSNDLRHYMNSALWDDPQMLDLMARVEAYPHPDAVGEKALMASVDIELTDGRAVSALEQYRRGSPKNPVSKDLLDAKVRNLCGSVLSPRRIDELMRTVDTIEDAVDIGVLASRLVAERDPLRDESDMPRGPPWARPFLWHAPFPRGR